MDIRITGQMIQTAALALAKGLELMRRVSKHKWVAGSLQERIKVLNTFVARSFTSSSIKELEKSVKLIDAVMWISQA